SAKSRSSFSRRGQRSPSAIRPTHIRYLPFAQDTFRLISNELMIHSGISRVISRQDVATFCAGEVTMGKLKELAIVYHCRTSSAWDGDLALSVTHNAKRGSTNAIIFGTDPENEDEIVGRLSFSSKASQHPFLLPGIFAEIERERQLKRLVGNIQVELEKVILDVSSQGESQSNQDSTQHTIDLWLDTTELRNGLVNWKKQLEEMLLHIEEMAGKYSSSRVLHQPAASSSADANTDVMQQQAKVNDKIRNRLRSIIHEYDEMIRDCTMRLDGMSMANQLSHAKTNMQIAIETKLDGKRIQNISIFSKVFLPSMFVARSDTRWILPSVHTASLSSQCAPEISEVVVDGLTRTTCALVGRNYYYFDYAFHGMFSCRTKGRTLEDMVEIFGVSVYSSKAMIEGHY
ncbi:hypothetical protein CORC01_08720, partial [Colletotrichum orchidophilum]